MTFRTIGLLNILLFFIIMIFTAQPWYFLMLTVAQIIFIPLVLHLVTEDDAGLFAKILPFAGMPAFIAIMILGVTIKTAWDPVLAGIYLAFTALVALYGFIRFLKRGFIHMEEFFIDIGLMYLVIGGAWFFAYTNEINAGFTPMITWLTSIHFHYSAFILIISIGFLGRIHQSTTFIWAGFILMIAPMIVALGITFSVWLELISVLIYMIGIYSFIILTCKIRFDHYLQKWLIRTSFLALGITIIFSLLYAYGNSTGSFTITIDFMLRFHGILNTCLFALMGILGWMLRTPKTRYRPTAFPVSKIRGNAQVGEAVLKDKTDEVRYNGLIDQLEIYEPHINMKILSPAIIDFYENTNDYHLYASVQWRPWFKPLAVIYRMVSRIVKQLNLPFSSEYIEMTGKIISVQDKLDGRKNVRAWVRKMNKEPIFVALYSTHKSRGRTYMNIALPLPYSSMHGILALQQNRDSLRLTSKKVSNECDAGIYLGVRGHLSRLPLEEQFDIKATSNSALIAVHKMWLWNIPFLTIDYDIRKES